MRIIILFLCLFINQYELKIHKVIDGDTIEADIHLGFGVTLSNRRIRCLDYDAWESSKRRKSVKLKPGEIKKGKIAKKALEDLYNKSSSAYMEKGEKEFDNYGRILGRIFFISKDGKTIEVSEYMKKNNHVRSLMVHKE